jgi:hypothetical protein
MIAMLSDTHPKVEAVQLQLLRQAPPWQKANMLGQMYETVKQLAYQGLRKRHPDLSDIEIRRRLADLLLGDDLAQQVYGPLVLEKDAHAN